MGTTPPLTISPGQLLVIRFKREVTPLLRSSSIAMFTRHSSAATGVQLMTQLLKSACHYTFVVVLSVSVGCSSLPPAIHSQSHILDDGRLLSVVTDSDAVSSAWKVEPRRGEAPVQVEIDGTDILITDSALTVNGQVVAAIPPDAKQIEIRNSEGFTRISTDGSTLYQD